MINEGDAEAGIPAQPEPTWRLGDPDTPTQVHRYGGDDPNGLIGNSADEAPLSPRARFEPEAQRTGVTDPADLATRPALGLAAYGVPQGPTAGSRRAADPNPIVDSGVHFIAQPESTPDDAPRCAHCGGRMPTDHELLMEIYEWVAPIGPQAMHQFYENLFAADPDLRELFPEEIETQEEKLLSAIVALLRLFNAGETEMEQLDSALARYGRSHTRFDPPATIEEYATVKTVLFGVLGPALGSKLTKSHLNVLTRAYEYAAGKMLAAQATAKFTGTGRRRRNG